MRDLSNVTIDEKFSKGHGKKNHQKMKPFLVYRYLLKNTDNEHTASAKKIEEYLNSLGIYAERRGIYNDIKEINRILWLMENNTDKNPIDIEDAIEAFEEFEESGDDSQQAIVYDKKSKGFYIARRQYETIDLQLLAECIYSANFLSESQVENLFDSVLGSWISRYEMETIKHDAFHTERLKTNAVDTIYKIQKIDSAMKANPPVQITFKPLSNEVSGNAIKPIKRDTLFKVSPLRLFIRNNKYLLLCVESKSNRIRLAPVERMADIELTDEPIVNSPELSKLNSTNYYQMMRDEQREYTNKSFGNSKVVLRIKKPFLSVALDYLGKDSNNTVYREIDSKHFEVRTTIPVDFTFLGWVSSYGASIKIVSPEKLVRYYKSYLANMLTSYNEAEGIDIPTIRQEIEEYADGKRDTINITIK